MLTRANAIGCGQSAQRGPRGRSVTPPLPQLADDAGREEVDAQDEQHAEPQQPAVGVQQGRQQRQRLGGLGGRAHQLLQVVLRHDEQRGADHRAVHRAHAADDDHQQDVEHDGERQRRVGTRVPQPQRIEGARQHRHARRQAVGGRAVVDGAVAQRLGAEVVLADRLQHAPERRVDDPQRHQEQRQRGKEHDVVGERASRHDHAERRQVDEREVRPQHLRHAERAAVLAAGDVGELRRQDRERGGDRERHHGKEDGAHPEREQPDQEGQRDAGDERERRGRSAPPPTSRPSRRAPAPRRSRRARRTWCGRRRRCRCSRAGGRSSPPAG